MNPLTYCKHKLVFRKKIYNWLANQALALPGENLMRLSHPFGHFMLHKVFSPVTRMGFGVWGTLGYRGQISRVRGHRYKQTLLYINRWGMIIIYMFFLRWPVCSIIKSHDVTNG